MKLIDDVKHVVWFDLALFHKRPRLLVALIGAMFVPALYATIYLTSAWDPYGHLDALPVALVNLDDGADVRGEHVVVGARMVEKLVSQHTFAWHAMPSEDEAKRSVTHGDSVFALVIPRDFSELAVPGSQAQPGHIRILFSEGNNFMAATIARRFAGELAHSTNETLNEQRFRVVLETVDRSKGSLEQLRSGVAQLDDGAQKLVDGLAAARAGSAKLAVGATAAKAGAAQLADGSARLADGAGALADGVVKLGGGLRTLDEKLPSSSTLAQLKDGAHQIADGNAKLADGLKKLDDGAHAAKDGADQLRTGTAKVPIVGGKISEGAGKLEDGLAKLAAGAADARAGADKLKDGSKKVDDGVTRLTDGVAAAHDGVHTMVEKLPADAKLGELKSGASQVADGAKKLDDGLGALADGSHKLDDGVGALADGSAQLKAGLALLRSSLPAGAEGLPGDARGLAASVQPELVALTSVGPYGNSMAPYFVGLSLWVGVVMSGFIFKLRWFPSRLRTLFKVSRLSLVLGRLAVPLVMALGQATLLTLAMRFVVGVPVPSLPSLWLITLVTSAVFLTVLLLLIAVFGDVGKVIALLLLVFQMSASAGVFPVELTSGVFRAVHPFLPFTWVVQSARALLFGAFDGAWGGALLRVAVFGVISILGATLFGRWKFVKRHEMGPLLDV